MMKAIEKLMYEDAVYDHFQIGTKDVFVVEEHHRALLPWALIRRRLPSPPNLISLDHHTDTLDAFLRFRSAQASTGFGSHDSQKFHELLPPLIASMDWRDTATISHAISRLRNDEHISAAAMSDIIDWAFSINLSRSTTSSIEQVAWRREHLQNLIKGIPFPEPPYTYDPPSSRIFEISSICAVGCAKSPHDDACIPTHYTQVLESIYLDDQLTQAQEMFACVGSGGILNHPYILDIDLDYFHLESAIQPLDAATFYALIRNAVGITLATEPDFVDHGRIGDSQITSEKLLETMFSHIENAIGL
jgi:hypothetical protein